MRRFLIAVLLSGAAASPALAQDWNDHGHHHNQQNNNNNGKSNQSQQSRGQGHAERGNGNGGNYYRQQAPQFVRQQQVQQGQRGNWNGQRFEGRGNVAEQRQLQQQAYGNRTYRGGFAGQAQQRGNWNGQRGTWNGQRGVQVRQGSRYAGGAWNRNWRNDRRYDWRGYRNNHRSAFRLGIYYDPFGYGYQPFDIGFQLAPGYFGRQYWIDPAMYELPYPPPGTQWIRYWNDAVLVDMYSGEVVDVIHDFFW